MRLSENREQKQKVTQATKVGVVEFVKSFLLE